MTTASHEKPKGSLIERGLRWDIGFNRRMGVVATAAAGGIAILGAPVVAGFAAMYAAGNFVVAEGEQRLLQTFKKS